MASNNYYFLLSTQESFLENEVVEELLRERSTYYNSKKNNKSFFWVINSPSFVFSRRFQKEIENTNFIKQNRRKTGDDTKIFLTMIISTNIEFVQWLELRLGYFEPLPDIRIDSTLPSNTEYRSDGVRGVIPGDEIDRLGLSPLESKSRFIDPKLILSRFQEMLYNYYAEYLELKST